MLASTFELCWTEDAHYVNVSLIDKKKHFATNEYLYLYHYAASLAQAVIASEQKDNRFSTEKAKKKSCVFFIAINQNLLNNELPYLFI